MKKEYIVEFIEYSEDKKVKLNKDKEIEFNALALLIATKLTPKKAVKVLKESPYAKKRAICSMINKLETYAVSNSECTSVISINNLKSSSKAQNARSTGEIVRDLMKKYNLPMNEGIYVDLTRIHFQTSLKDFEKKVNIYATEFMLERGFKLLRTAFENGIKTRTGKYRELDGLDVLHIMDIDGDVIARNLDREFAPEEIKKIKTLIPCFNLVFKSYPIELTNYVNIRETYNGREITTETKEKVAKYFKKENLPTYGSLLDTARKAEEAKQLKYKRTEIDNFKRENSRYN